MSIRRLRISQLRNIRQAELELRRVNLLCGPNGSGKTSVLEAVFVLGSGRSFRATRLDPVIHHEARQCTVFASLLGEEEGAGPVAIGVSRDRDGSFVGRIQGQAIRSSAELARRLPLQLINSDTFALLEGGPKVRRQFLDWGCSTWNMVSTASGWTYTAACASATRCCGMIEFHLLNSRSGAAVWRNPQRSWMSCGYATSLRFIRFSSRHCASW